MSFQQQHRHNEPLAPARVRSAIQEQVPYQDLRSYIPSPPVHLRFRRPTIIRQIPAAEVVLLRPSFLLLVGSITSYSISSIPKLNRCRAWYFSPQSLRAPLVIRGAWRRRRGGG